MSMNNSAKKTFFFCNSNIYMFIKKNKKKTHCSTATKEFLALRNIVFKQNI